MDRRAFLRTLPAIGVLAASASSLAQDLEPITLAEPQTEGGLSVLAALSKRRTDRNIGSKE
ncbi:MAG: hypothetical protein ACYSW8_13745, partial [Planctomycetota bacterium]